MSFGATIQPTTKPLSTQASPGSWRGTAWSHSLSLTCYYCETLTSELQCPHLPNTDLNRNDAKNTWQISGGNMFSDFLSCERKSRLASPTCSLGELGFFGNQAEVVGPSEVLEKGPQISSVNHIIGPGQPPSPSSSLESKHEVSRKLLMHLLPRRS